MSGLKWFFALAFAAWLGLSIGWWGPILYDLLQFIGDLR